MARGYEIGARCKNCGDYPRVCFLCSSCWRAALVSAVIAEAVHWLAGVW